MSSSADGLTGELAFDPDRIAETAVGSVAVPLTRMSFGDRVKDWGMRRHLNVKRWPKARFDVHSVQVESREPWRARIEGVIQYRDAAHSLSVMATGAVDEEELSAHTVFECRLSDLGLKPPRFLMLKVADVIRVDVRLYASAVGC